MQIIPAIDLRGGQCVRLRQGDYSRETVFSSDPAAMARSWVEQGAEYLHLVDLDGARQGHVVNSPSIQAILAAVAVPCELGGGLRAEAQIQEALGWGLDRAVVGTKALKDPAWFEQICHRFPGRIALGIDARDGLVATDGWESTSSCTVLELANRCAGWPLAAVIYTDIGRDGMLEGPNFEALESFIEKVRFPVIASGGVSTLDDIRRLNRIPLAGCIVGRALYENRLDLKAAIAVTRMSSQ